MKSQRTPLASINANQRVLTDDDVDPNNPFVSRSRIQRTPNEKSVIKKKRIENDSIRRSVEKKLIDDDITKNHIEPIIKYSNTGTTMPVVQVRLETSSTHIKKPTKIAKNNRRLSVDDLMVAIRSSPAKARDEADIALVLIGRLLPSEFKEYVRVFRDGKASSLSNASSSSSSKKLTPRSRLINHLSDSPHVQMVNHVDSGDENHPVMDMAHDDAMDMEQDGITSTADVIIDNQELIADIPVDDNISAIHDMRSPNSLSLSGRENPFKPKRALGRTPPKPDTMDEMIPVSVHQQEMISSPKVSSSLVEDVIEDNIAATTEDGDDMSSSYADVDGVYEEQVDAHARDAWTTAELDKATEVVRRMSLHHDLNHKNLPPQELLTLKQEIEGLKYELDEQRSLLQQSIQDNVDLQDRIDDMQSIVKETEFKQLRIQEQFEQHHLVIHQQEDHIYADEMVVLRSEMERLDEIKKMIMLRRTQRLEQQQRLISAFLALDTDTKPTSSSTLSTAMHVPKPIIDVSSDVLAIQQSTITSPKLQFTSILSLSAASAFHKPIAIKAMVANPPPSSINRDVPPLPMSSILLLERSSSNQHHDDLSSDRSCFIRQSSSDRPPSDRSSSCAKLVATASVVDRDPVVNNEDGFHPIIDNDYDNVDDNNDYPMEYDASDRDLEVEIRPLSDPDPTLTQATKPATIATNTHHNSINHNNNRPAKHANRVLEDISDCVNSNQKSKNKPRATKYRQSQLHERWQEVALDDIDGRPAMAKAGNMKFVPIQAIMNTLRQHDHDSDDNINDGDKVVVDKVLFPSVEDRVDDGDASDDINHNDDGQLDEDHESKKISKKSIKSFKKVSNVTQHSKKTNELKVKATSVDITTTDPKPKKRSRKVADDIVVDVIASNPVELVNQDDACSKKKRSKNSKKRDDVIVNEPDTQIVDVVIKQHDDNVATSSQSDKVHVVVADKVKNKRAKSNPVPDTDMNMALLPDEVLDQKKKSSRSKKQVAVEAVADVSTTISSDTIAINDNDENKSVDAVAVVVEKKKRGRKPKSLSEDNMVAIPAAIQEPTVSHTPIIQGSAPLSLSIAAAKPVDRSKDKSKAAILSPVRMSEEDSHHMQIDDNISDDDSDDDLVMMVKPIKKPKRKQANVKASESKPLKVIATTTSTDDDHAEEKENKADNDNLSFPVPLLKKKRVEVEMKKNVPMPPSVSSTPAPPSKLMSRNDFSVARTTALLNTSVSSSILSNASSRSGFMIPKLKKR